MSKMAKEWNERYCSSDTPWHKEEFDSSVNFAIIKYLTPNNSLLEIGCGKGVESVGLVQKKLRVTGIDLSEEAIRLANRRREELEDAELKKNLHFQVANFLQEEFLHQGLFDAVFDRTCFHGFGTHGERLQFAAKVFSALKERGIWINISASLDNMDELEAVEKDLRRPPMLSFQEIISSVEDHFRLLEVQPIQFNVLRDTGTVGFYAWCSVFQRRTKKRIQADDLEGIF